MSQSSNALVLAFPHAGFLAHTVRLLGIAECLREIGYRVVFFASGKFARLITDAGFALESVYSLDPDALMARLRYGDVEFYTQDTYGRSVREELEIFRRHEPACVLGDHRWSLRSSTEIAGVPYVSVLNASWTRFWSLPIRPYDHHPLTRAFGGSRVGRRLTRTILPFAATMFKKAGAREQNAWRRRHGLREFRVHLESFEGDINLLADLPELSPCRELPDNFTYIGPPRWEPADPAPKWLTEYEKSRPIVYVSFGSTGEPKYIPVVLELLEDRDVDVIVTTGGLAQVTETPPNCRVAEFLPGSAVAALSDLLVCHGGNGTIYQALFAGVPIVGIPTCITQEIEMDQVERLSCGVQVSETRFDRDELRCAIRKGLDDPVLRSSSRRAQATLRASRDRTGDRATERISRFLAG